MRSSDQKQNNTTQHEQYRYQVRNSGETARLHVTRKTTAESRCSRLVFFAIQPFAQQTPKRLQPFDVVANNLDGPQNGNGEDQTHGSPYPSPDQQTEGYGQGIQFQSAANHLRIKHVHREHVQAENDYGDDEDTCSVQHANAGGNRRQQRENHSKIGNQTEETADESEKIKIWQVKEGEDDSAGNCHKYPDDEIADNEALHHL